MDIILYEGIVPGVPVSSNADAKGKAKWKQKVAEIVKKTASTGQRATPEPVWITVGYYTKSDIFKKGGISDSDNIGKPVQDGVGMSGIIYQDDIQVTASLFYKQNLDELVLADLSDTLLAAIATLTSFVYIRVEVADMRKVPRISYEYNN